LVNRLLLAGMLHPVAGGLIVCRSMSKCVAIILVRILWDCGLTTFLII